MSQPTSALSKLISRMLRDEPARQGLELDAEGWVDVDALLSAVRRHGSRWRSVDRGDLYGHSTPGMVQKTAAEPPPQLFHGTAPRSVPEILTSRLRPMGRQYVHLSVDRETALSVGRRKSPSPVVLRIRAVRASASGVAFYPGNETIWLPAHVPPEYIDEPEKPQARR